MRIYLLILLVLIPLVPALEECKGTTVITEIPCLVFLPYSGDCGEITVDFFNETSSIQSRTMANYSGFLCNATFNYSTLGTYAINFSTGDTASIIVERDSDMLLAITLGLGIFAGFLFFLAFKLEDNHYLMKLIMVIMGITTLTLLPVTYITGDTSIVFHKITLWFIGIFWIYVSIYFIYWIFQKMARTVP